MVQHSKSSPVSSKNSHKIAKLEHVRSALFDLRRITAGDDDDMLGYLIEMAYLEASASLGQAYNDARAGSETPT